jgi:hypothetical protein
MTDPCRCIPGGLVPHAGPALDHLERRRGALSPHHRAGAADLRGDLHRPALAARLQAGPREGAGAGGADGAPPDRAGGDPAAPAAGRQGTAGAAKPVERDAATKKPEPEKPASRKPSAPAKVALNKEAPVPEARVPVPDKPPGEVDAARRKVAGIGLLAMKDDVQELHGAPVAVQLRTDIKQGPGVGTSTGSASAPATRPACRPAT